MRTPPEDLSEDRLVRLLAAAWQFPVADLRYAPVGFGSHHWVATDASGDRRFVTVDGLDESGVDAHLARLRRALLTARILSDQARCGFVVAPLPAVDGSVVRSLAPGWAVATFPYVVGGSFPSGDDSSAQDRGAVVELVARLHGATATAKGTAGVDGLELSGRSQLEHALGRLGEPWTGGPFAEGTRGLLTSSAADLRTLLTAYDELASAVRSGAPGWVITHGEPKADNLLVTGAGLRLVDWDTALVAPAARDLWMLDAGSGDELDRYAELTGRRATPEELTFYRLRWDLADIADYVRWFAQPHAGTPDTEIGWASLVKALQLHERWSGLLRRR